MSKQNERFNILIKKWVESGINKIETFEIDKMFRKLAKADKKTENKLLLKFNDKLEQLLKERKAL